MNSETHISTKQASQSDDTWISQPYGNCRRSQSDQSPTPTRTQKVNSLVLYRFPKSARLRRRQEFLRIKQSGSLVKGRFLRVLVSQGEAGTLKLGLTATRRYGNSCQRNRFKRLVREAFRLCQHDLPPGLIISVMPRPYAKKATLHDIQQDLHALFCSDPTGEVE